MATRRNFIKGICAGGILAQLPLFVACNNQTSYRIILPHKHYEIAQSFFDILFPDKLAPGYKKLNTLFHLNQILSDPNQDPDEIQYLKNGFIWTDETAQENFSKDFYMLDNKAQEELFQKVLQTNWGESWLSRLLTIIFESLLLDPIYNVNLQQAGWNWLQHVPGHPRPNNTIVYPHILNRKNESMPINSLNQL